MDYLLQTLHKLLDIMKLAEFYLIIVNIFFSIAANVTNTHEKQLVSHGSHQQCPNTVVAK